jgi:predicted GIY-YIG superfamily endonuclease
MAELSTGLIAGRVPDRFLGTVYLLHFDKPYRHARHYVGWAKNINARLAQHEAGQGARLLQVVRDAGITWTLARTWEGTRNRERQIKRMGSAARRCPMCGVTPKPDRPAELSTEWTTAYRLRELTDRWWECADPVERARIDDQITALTDHAPCIELPGAITAHCLPRTQPECQKGHSSWRGPGHRPTTVTARNACRSGMRPAR